jgi:hypothetical protein
VDVKNLPAGFYDLFVGGVRIGMVQATETGEGMAEFASPQNEGQSWLDFDVLGKTITVSQGDVVLFDDTFPSGEPPAPTAGKETIQMALNAVGPDKDAHGVLRWQRTTTKSGTATRVDLEVEDMNPATYDVLVDGEPVGVLTTSVESGEAAELHFSDPPEPGGDALDFDPLGRLVSVNLGAAFLAAAMPASSLETGVPTPSKPSQICKDIGKKSTDCLQVAFSNLGVLPGPSGTATMVQNASGIALKVDLQGLPPGADFDIASDGNVVATVEAGEDGTASTTFQSPLGDADVLLDFDAKGRMLDVLSGEDVILSTVMPTSVQSALGTFKKEKHSENDVRLNLENMGADLDATGFLAWQRKNNGKETMVVKVADLDPGAYDVLIDGVLLGDGVLVVSKPDGTAKVTFDSDATGSGGKQPLDVPVLGHVVTITPDHDNSRVLLETWIQ